MIKPTKSNIIFRKGVHFGEVSAEDDIDLLINCFVNLPAYSELTNLESSKSILLGRTGSGKSALLVHLLETEENAVQIDPKEFAFSYLSNSNIIAFVTDLGCDLNLLYGYLWKHVMLCKIVELYFDNRSTLDAAIDSILKKSNPAIQYFNEFKGKFWINHDTTVKEISEGFESSINSELRGVLGNDFAKVEAGMGGELKLNNSQKKHIVSRVKRATSEIQIHKLSAAINTLNDLLKNKEKKFYLLVDDLDSDWIDTSRKYQMIRSLVDCIKSFRKIRTVKLIICLRSDVYEKSILSHSGEGFQPEKYEGIYSEIRWSVSDLKTFADLRIVEVFKNKYTKKNVGFSDVFPETIRKNESFGFLCDRTQLRPRDLLSFINSIFDQAAGNSKITEKAILQAEADYSKKRYDALKREWEIVHPHLGIYLELLKGRTGTIRFSDFSTKDTIDELCLQIQSDERELAIDAIENESKKYFQRQTNSLLDRTARTLVATLYKVGAIELKMVKGDIYRSSFRNESLIIPEQISNEATFKVCPMLWRTLAITPNI